MLKKNSKLSNFKFYLYMKKLMIRVRIQEIKSKRLRKRYCHKGFHKLSKCIYSVKRGEERTRKVEYLSCRYCNYKFFAKLSDKKWYNSEMTKGNSVLVDFLSCAKSKHSISSGRKLIGNVSVSIFGVKK